MCGAGHRLRGAGKQARYAPAVIIQVLVALAGVVLIARTVLSAVRTFVVPRGVNDRLTRLAFVVIRKGFTLAAPPSRPTRPATGSWPTTARSP